MTARIVTSTYRCGGSDPRRRESDGAATYATLRRGGHASASTRCSQTARRAEDAGPPSPGPQRDQQDRFNVSKLVTRVTQAAAKMAQSLRARPDSRRRKLS
jgi:hypothetical protein